MAVTQTSLTSGTDDNAGSGTSIATASIAPTSNYLVLVSVVSNVGGHATGVSGAGLTFTQVGTGVTLNDSYLSIWRALSASPSSGAVTITFSSAPELCLWSISEFGGIDTGGTNGSSAVVQTATNSTTADTTLTVTLSAFGSANNATFGAFSGKDNTATATGTPGTGFTEIHDLTLQDGDFSYHQECYTEWRNDNDTGVDMTFSATRQDILGQAIEIKAAAAAASSSNLTLLGAG